MQNQYTIACPSTDFLYLMYKCEQYDCDYQWDTRYETKPGCRILYAADYYVTRTFPDMSRTRGKNIVKILRAQVL